MAKKPALAVVVSQAERDAAHAALSAKIVEKRDDAVSARTASGIEETWKALEDAYLGVDDYNRHEYADAKWSKPTSMTGPVTTARVDQDASRSTAYVRLTARYVDAGYSRLAEMTLPIDEKAFAFKALPDPELIKHKDDLEQMTHPNGTPMMRAAKPEEMPAGPPPAPAGAPESAPNVGSASAAPSPMAPRSAPAVAPMTKADWYTAQMTKAQAGATLAEQRVQRWLLTSKFQAEARKVMQDAARLGAGVLKGPFPEPRRSMAITKSKDEATGKTMTAVQVKKETAPAVRWVDVWNLWPAPGCGENIHDGDYIFEGDFMTPRAVRELGDQKDANGKPIYIKAALKHVLEEGPNKALAEGRNPNRKEERDKDKRFQVFHYTGFIKRGEAEYARPPGIELLQGDDVPVTITLINDTIVKVALNPLDSGAFPYCVFSWSRRAGHWAGIGVGEQVATPQRICNGGTRALLNNAGKSAGSQIIVDRDAVEPADGEWTITPDKVWYMTGEGTDPDVRKAMMFMEVPNVGAAMMGVIEYSFKLAEELSNIPLHTQGLESGNAPETFGAAEMLNSNAKTLLRSVANRWDDAVTEPLVTNFYEWLLLDEDVPEEEKQDFEINAEGSIAMVERAIQEQTLQIIANMANDPGYGINKRRFFAEFMRAKRMSPATVQNTPEEQAKIDAAPQAPPVQIAVAQERSKAAMGVQQSKAQTALAVAKTQSDGKLAIEQFDAQQEQAQRDAGVPEAHVAAAEARKYEADVRAETARNNQVSNDQTQLAYVQAEAQIARDNHAFNIRKLELEERLEMLKYANAQKVSLDQIKADLAKAQMNNQTKIEVAGAQSALHTAEGRNDRTHDLAKHASTLRMNAVDSAQEREHDARMRAIELDTTQSEPGAEQ